MFSSGISKFSPDAGDWTLGITYATQVLFSTPFSASEQKNADKNSCILYQNHHLSKGFFIQFHLTKKTTYLLEGVPCNVSIHAYITKLPPEANFYK
jgi:hypothetical protein